MINKAILIGNLGKDPELRNTQSGQAVCNFSVATTDRYKDAQGNVHDDTTWHNIVVWGKLAEICSEILSKGSKVYIEGKIQNRKWKDTAGVDRYTTEINAREMKCLDRRQADGGEKNHDIPLPPEPFGGTGSDDEIPF